MGADMQTSKKVTSEIIRIEGLEQIKAVKKTGSCPACKENHALIQWGGSQTVFADPLAVKNTEIPEWLDFRCPKCGRYFEINKKLYDSA